MARSIRYLVLSDIHLGHPRNTTDCILEHLTRFFLENDKLIQDLDLIVLAGDVYDRLLNLPSKEAIDANRFLTNLIGYCSKRKIALRILEGTPSHDWRQCRVLVDIIDNLGIDVDFRYIDQIVIDTVCGYDFLYVPDEYNPTTTETMSQIDTLLDGRIVDVAIVHGQFAYHLPVYKENKVFDEQFFLDRVKHYIHVGHIHTFSTYHRIITHGSFDRLAHGEEEAKGCLYVTLSDTCRRYVFLENKYATIFKTIDLDRIETIDDLDGIIHTLPKGSHIRIQTSQSHPLYNRRELLQRYRDYRLRFQVVTTGKQPVDLSKAPKIESIALTRSTLIKQVTSVKDQFDLHDPDHVEETISKFLT